MNAGPWLIELLEALERLTQTMQKNTAALSGVLAYRAAPPEVVREQLREQLEQARAIEARIAVLREQLQAPAGAICGKILDIHVGTGAMRCLRPIEHDGPCRPTLNISEWRGRPPPEQGGTELPSWAWWVFFAGPALLGTGAGLFCWGWAIVHGY